MKQNYEKQQAELKAARDEIERAREQLRVCEENHRTLLAQSRGQAPSGTAGTVSKADYDAIVKIRDSMQTTNRTLTRRIVNFMPVDSTDPGEMRVVSWLPVSIH